MIKNEYLCPSWCVSVDFMVTNCGSSDCFYLIILVQKFDANCSECFFSLQPAAVDLLYAATGGDASLQPSSPGSGAYVCHILISCFLEIRRRGSKDLLKVCVVMEGSEGTADEAHPAPVQIYDIPYEGGGDSEKTAITRPELDTRPSTEYELPWEWKKEHIVKTLSGTVEFIHVFSYYSHAIKANSKKKQTKNNIHFCICALLSRLCSTFQPVSLLKQCFYNPAR